MVNEENCLMCMHSDYGWYEVMAACCGITDNPSDKLCDSHIGIFRDQLEEQVHGANHNE